MNSQEYVVPPNQNVFLTMTVGNGQIEVHTMHLNDEKIELEDDTKVKDVEIEFDPEQESQTLEIASNISNNNDLTLAIITYTLSGGVDDEVVREKEFINNAVAIYTDFKFRIDRSRNNFT